MPTAAELRTEFLLDPEVTFLNHGSFGACPLPVLECYQEWQRELEREPVRFIARRLPELLDAARARLAEYVGAAPDDLAFVPNATTGVNLAARSLELGPGDEVLATSLEYGACDLAWEWLCDRMGARYVRADVSLPIARPDDVVDALFAARSERTRVVFVSHITSDTGLLLPVDAIVARAHAEGLPVVVDGAHGPAQAPLDLERLGADFYAGNCHKWRGSKERIPRGTTLAFASVQGMSPDTHTPRAAPCAWSTRAAFVVFAVYACSKLWSSMTSCVTSPGRFGLTLFSNHWACCSWLSQISATVNPVPAAS